MERSEQVISVYDGESDLMVMILVVVGDMYYIEERVVMYYRPSWSGFVKSVENCLNLKMTSVLQLQLFIAHVARKFADGKYTMTLLAPLESNNQNKSARDIKMLNEHGGRELFERKVIKCGTESN